MSGNPYDLHQFAQSLHQYRTGHVSTCPLLDESCVPQDCEACCDLPECQVFLKDAVRLELWALLGIPASRSILDHHAPLSFPASSLAAVLLTHAATIRQAYSGILAKKWYSPRDWVVEYLRLEGLGVDAEDVPDWLGEIPEDHLIEDLFG